MKAFGRAPLAKDEVLLTWLETIARRAVADAALRRKRLAGFEGSMPDQPVDGDLESETGDAACTCI